MSNAVLSQKNNQMLRVLDPDLPLLASEAAVDIDNMLSNKAQDFGAIRRLAELIDKSFGLGSGSVSSRSLMDSATLVILGEIASSTGTNTDVVNVDEALKNARGIAASLSADNPLKNRQALEQARDFCITLSRATVAYNESIRDLQPPHPFRR